MNIANIKELFSKRIRESDSCNNVEDSSSNKTSSKIDENEELEDCQFTSLSEEDAGITEYLNDCKGFSGVIKQRFSDFNVHEIDMDGNVVYLTNFDIPVVKMQPVNEDIISKELWDEIKKLQDKALKSVEIDVTDFSKEKRKDIHKAIKMKYGPAFNSNTVKIDNKKLLVVSLGKDSHRDDLWYSDLGNYLHFVVFKQNLDTVNAINIIASHLRIKACNLTYAGTKDKRGNTSQLVSMWHLDAKRLNGINKILRGMRVGNFIYKESGLSLGDLKGNLFEIALRNVTAPDAVINYALNALKKNGFINYFGLQRFGNSIEVPTYEIGKALVKGDFKHAVELILRPRKGKMKSDLREARNIWWETRDADKAYKCLKSKHQTIEGQLLLGLIKHGKNAYVNALDYIPRNTRLLYLHAYQSFIWNKVLSKRIKKFGKCVIEGDMVLINDKQKEENMISEKYEKESNVLNNMVCHLSEDKVKDFDVTDIVHPLPGYNISYPNNIIKQWYDELLKEDGLTSENFKQTVKKYSLSGTYRHIVKQIKDLSWHVCYYSEPDQDLILSDLDKLNEVELKVTYNSEREYKAVILKFSLDSSTYATMALREILKIDTSCSHQATLNSYPMKRSFEDVKEGSRKKNRG